MGLSKFEMICTHHYSIIWSSFTDLKILIHGSHICPSLPLNPWQLLIFLLSHSFAFSKRSYSWNHTVCNFSDWLFPLSHMHLISCRSFCDLIVLFFLVLNNTPLSECTTVYLSIHLLKGILVASKF